MWQSHLGNTKFLLSEPEDLALVVLLHVGTWPSPERSNPGFSSPSLTNPGAVSSHHPGLDTDSTPWSRHWLHWGTGDQPGLGSFQAFLALWEHLNKHSGWPAAQQLHTENWDAQRSFMASAAPGKG